MKTKLMFIVFAICAYMSFGQTNMSQSDVQVGTELVIGKAENSSYQHIHFPKANIIIKRGGIANYKSVQGDKVVVTAVSESDNGAVIVTIKRKDDRAFFGTHKTVKANLEKALKTKELNKG